MARADLRALLESEERYRLLFERAGDGIWLADRDGRFVDVNPAASRMLGYSREEHLALSVVDVFEVGGDWYDAVVLAGGRLAVAVGDVVGKGAAAAAAMGQLRSAARALLLEGHGPAQVLTALDAFAARIPDACCSTMFCALIDPHRATVSYSSAGHPPAILDQGAPDDGDRFELLERAQSVPLAVLDGVQRPQATAMLPPGSTLLLYTDGLVERRGQSIDVGIKAAAAVLAGARSVTPAECASQLAGS